jgi:hypothetical protein
MELDSLNAYYGKEDEETLQTKNSGSLKDSRIM